jgi:hypothetical protein
VTRAALRTACALILVGVSFAAAAATMRTSRASAYQELVGPWSFRLGDDLAWSRPGFDASAWESVDLTASPGAHDEDVGLTGFVPGWGARGHSGYDGFAWYRLRVSLRAAPGEPLLMAGPAAVDSAYQVFCNGQLLGGEGDFSRSPPAVTSIRPHLYSLGVCATGNDAGAPAPMVIAFRVWMAPWDLDDPAGGGIRIAPVMGAHSAVVARYRQQWGQTFRGYIVEVVEALAFALLALMAGRVYAREAARGAYAWLAAALILTGLYRANQALFAWTHLETVPEFTLISLVLLLPLCLYAWTMTWYAWFAAPRLRWIPRLAAAAAAVCILGEFASRPWLHGSLAASAGGVWETVVTWDRLLFLLMTVVIVYAARRSAARDRWWSLGALVLVSIGVYARELSSLHVPGIWFPFGTGVSRTQYAYAAFAGLLFALLWRRRRSKSAVPTARAPASAT